MLFGLMNALSALQRFMNELDGSLQFVEGYLDDVVIYSATIEERINCIRQVNLLVAEQGPRVKFSKWEHAREKVMLLEHTVDEKEV